MNWKAIIAAGAIVFFTGNAHAQATNVALHKPVIPIGLDFFTGAGGAGDPSLFPSVTDGIFLPPWTPWVNGTVWWVLNACQHPDSQEVCTLEIDLQGTYRIESLVFQGDSDTYFLQYWDMVGGGWQNAWIVYPHDPATGYFGAIQTRPDPATPANPDPPASVVKYMLPEPIVTDRLRVIPSPSYDFDNFPGTDNLYAVSEIQAWGEPSDPPPPPFVDCLELVCFEQAEKWEAFLTDELGFCYKVELSCDDRVGGGLGINMHPDGRVEGGYGFFIPGEPYDCGGFLTHLGNNKMVHSCAFDTGEVVELEVKAAPMSKCLGQVASCRPPLSN